MKTGTGSIAEKKFLLALVVLLALALPAQGFAQPTCSPPSSGLIGWWPGDGNANDIIGGNNGVMKNGATFAAGKVGQAFSFDGVNAYMETASNVSLTGSAARTACA